MSIVLTPEQERAASHHEGMRSIIATAGAGKTTALATRISRLIDLKGCEESILATSFTNASARELKERIDRFLGRKSKIISGTFHSYCISLISKHYASAGFASEPQILNEYQWKQVIERLLIQETDVRSIEDLPYQIDYPLQWFSEFDVRHYSDNQLDRDPRLLGVDPPLAFKRVWELYRDKSRREGFLSYDDILTVALEILRSGIDTPKYVFIDEAQDLSGIQWLLVDELSKGAISVDVIGDDDQSIYAWRGARPKRFAQFSEKAEKVYLASNRRCGGDIVRLAKAVIEKIPGTRRIEKDLSAARDSLGRIRYSVLKHQHSYNMLARKIRYQVDYEGKKWSDYALISRAAGQVGGTFDRLQAALVSENIPFRLLGGDKKSYDRVECDFIKTLLSLSQRTSTETPILWENLLCGSGTSPAAAAGIVSSASSRGLSLESIRFAIKESRLSHASKSKYDALINGIYGFRQGGSFASVLSNPLVQNITSEIVGDDLKKKKVPQENMPEAREGRLKSVEILFDPFKDLSIKEASRKLLLDFETEKNEGNVVTISTAHSSKGLEWDTVYIIEANHRTWPNARSLQSVKGLSTGAFEAAMDEEIRLFYVAITRAKNELNFISVVEKEHLNARNEPPPLLPEPVRLTADSLFDEVSRGDKTKGIDIVLEK